MKQRSLGFAAVSALLIVAALAQPACAGSDAQTIQDPYAALRSGDYEAAIAGLRVRLVDNPNDLAARRALVDALVETAEYDDAIATAQGAPANASLAFANALGEALMQRGRVDEAEAAFRRAIDGSAPDANTARLNLAVLQLHHGQRQEALAGFDAFIDTYNQGPALGAEGLTAVGTAVKLLGVTDPQLFHDAVRAYDEAIKAADAMPPGTTLPAVAFMPRLLLGELFLEKYNSTEAQSLFREVLNVNPRHPRALLDMAAAKYFDGSTEPLDLARQSLEVAPNYVDARLFLARLQSDLENFDEAREQVERALEVNPASLDAIAVLAGINYVTGDRQAYEAARARALAIDPGDADFYNTVADMAVRQRRYKAAVELAREAVRLDSLSWWGYGIIGLNEMRGGDVGEARRNLEVAFAGDPYNVWIKNTLDLLDTFGEYRTETTERFSFMLHGSEAELLAPYFGAVAEEAYTKLAERYKYRPETPIRVEVYPSHADFSVRTVGLGGLGALGVAFGTQLAMDSPHARDQGEFNWGTTLWHEIAHTFTLGVSDHRVPRWMTEGLSVLEERRAREGWGEDVNLDFLGAYRRGDLLPIGELNQGFLRPSYPAQVAVSYFQASLVVELIETEHGFDAILRMLAGYRDGKSDAQVFEDVLDLELDAFNSRFNAYVEQRFGKQANAIPRRDPQGQQEAGRGSGAGGIRALFGGNSSPFAAAMIAGQQAVEAQNFAEARRQFETAKSLFPEYAGEQSPYRALANMYIQQEKWAEAAAELDKMTLRNERAYEANLQLAELYDRIGNRAGAATALERVVYIWPFDIELYHKLAELYTQLGAPEKVVLARRAIVALEPVDRAEALYQLALAYFEAGDRDNARRTVLRSLEIAPNYEAAQSLLLRVAGG